VGKLYRISTTDEIVARPGADNVHFGVTIHWFCDGRTHPAVPYSESIPAWEDVAGTVNLPQHYASYFHKLEAYVDQMFTHEEVEAVKECLGRARAGTIEVEEVSLPVTSFDIPYRNIPVESSASDSYGFVDSPGSPGHPLPVKVSGYFDTVYDTLHKRQQVASLDSLADRVEAEAPGPAGVDGEVRAIQDRIVFLRVALLGLQRALNRLTSRLQDESSDKPTA